MKFKHIIIIISCMVIIFTGCSKKAPEDNVAGAARASSITTQPPVKPEKQTPSTPKPASPTPEPAKEKITDPDFREIKWGMTRDELLEIEGEPDGENESIIAYYDMEAAGLSAALCYNLNDDGLIYGSMYSIDETHTNMTDYVDDYYTILAALIKKYGEPLEDEIIWKDDLYRDDPLDWGMAVCVGHMSMFASWETETTKIYVVISGDNYDITTTIMYLSKKVEQKVNDITSGL